MKTIVTHPDNEHAIRDAYLKATGDMWCLPIKTSRHINRYGPSAKIRLPDGSVVDRKEFSLRTRFITYGPEDLQYLMWSGVIQEQLEMLYYVIDDLAFSTFMDFGPKVMEPRRAIITSCIF